MEARGEGAGRRGRSFTDTRGWGSPGRAGRGAAGRGDSGSSRCYSPGCRPRERERGPPTQRARPPGNILEGRGPRGLPSSPALHAALAWAGDTCARELLCPGGTGRTAVLWLKGSAGRPWGGPSERRATGDTWTPTGDGKAPRDTQTHARPAGRWRHTPSLARRHSARQHVRRATLASAAAPAVPALPEVTRARLSPREQDPGPVTQAQP